MTLSIEPQLLGQKALVVGLGKSGRAAARLLASKGAHVTVADQKTKSQSMSQLRGWPRGCSFQWGQKKFSLKNVDLVVVSPGVPWSHPSLVKARKSGIPVWPELELGWRFVHPKQTLAITGTNGKTTTTALVGHIFKSARRPVVVGGNIGTPLSDLVDVVTSATTLVLEVSSYQMEAHQTFHPTAAALLNLTPDHMARHKTMKGYARAKARILINMTSSDTVVVNRADRWCRWMVKTSAVTIVPFPSRSLQSLARFIPLRGAHNLENAMAAAALCAAAGLSRQEIIRGLRSFKGVPHRIERIGKKRGVLYVNDSKGTNVDSTLVALKSFSEPVILLLGGEHKGTPYTPLRSLVKRGVRTVVAFGESQKIIEKDLRGTVPLYRVKNLTQAVSLAAREAKRGDVVLLSPACASFDQYKNFEERGAHFVSLVKRLPS